MGNVNSTTVFKEIEATVYEKDDLIGMEKQLKTLFKKFDANSTGKLDTKSAFFVECIDYMWPSVNPLRQMKLFESEYTKSVLSQEAIDVMIAISDKNVEKFTQICVSTFDKNQDGCLSEQEFNDTVSYLVKLLVSIKYSKQR